MPWFRLAFRPDVMTDLRAADPAMAQRLFDKTKWLASNVENLRHEPVAADLPGIHKYAVGDWRIYLFHRPDGTARGHSPYPAHGAAHRPLHS